MCHDTMTEGVPGTGHARSGVPQGRGRPARRGDGLGLPAAFRGCLVSGLIMLAAVGCQKIQALQALQEALVAAFQTSQVGVKLDNDTTLTVTIHDAVIAHDNGAERSAGCRRAAELVRDHYTGYGHLRQVRVVLGARKEYGPVAITRGEGCTFRTVELGPAPAREAAQDP